MPEDDQTGGGRKQARSAKRGQAASEGAEQGKTGRKQARASRRGRAGRKQSDADQQAPAGRKQAGAGGQTKAERRQGARGRGRQGRAGRKRSAGAALTAVPSASAEPEEELARDERIESRLARVEEAMVTQSKRTDKLLKKIGEVFGEVPEPPAASSAEEPPTSAGDGEAAEEGDGDVAAEDEQGAGSGS